MILLYSVLVILKCILYKEVRASERMPSTFNIGEESMLAITPLLHVSLMLIGDNVCIVSSNDDDEDADYASFSSRVFVLFLSYVIDADDLLLLFFHVPMRMLSTFRTYEMLFLA